MKTFNQFLESQLHEPTYPSSSSHYQPNGVQERLIVPIVRGWTMAVPIGMLTALTIGAFELSHINPWYAAPAVSLTVFTIVFWSSSERGQQLIETLIGQDLNNDGVIGDPPKQTPLPPVRIMLESDRGRHTEYIDLPHPEKLPALAAGLLTGREFAQTTWTGSGQLLSRGEFDAIRDAMLKRGLAAWKNPEAHSKGCVLTAPGRAVCRRLASLPPHPTQPGSRK